MSDPRGMIRPRPVFLWSLALGAFRFLHCSDLHLDSPLTGLERYPGAPVESLRGATREAWVQLIEFALAESVSFVVIAGDVFDGAWRDMNTGLFFSAQLRRLERAGIPVFLLRGNHDAASEISRALSLPENVRVFPSERPATFMLSELGVALHGRSFGARAAPEDFAAGYPAAVSGAFNIGVLHTSLAGYAAHDPYAPTTLDTLIGRGYDYWALGHVHAREVLREARPRIVFCGNLQGRHIGETGAKGCEYVEVVDGRLSARPIALDVLRWAEVLIDCTALTEPSLLYRHVEPALRAAHAAAEGRRSAWRLRVQAVEPVHRWLCAHREEVVYELRQRADACSAGQAWVEQVRLEAPPLAAQAPALSDAAGLEISRVAAALRADPEPLRVIGEAALSDLVAKLPAPLRSGPGSLGLDDPATLSALLTEAEALLSERLRGAGR